MQFDASEIQGIVFDYGNTLIEFADGQLARCDQALADALEHHFGHVDRAQLTRSRDVDRLAPYGGDPPAYRENDLAEITAALVRKLYGQEPTPQLLERLLEVRFETFVQAIEAPDYLHEVLERLGQQYRLGLLSNYPCGRAVRTSLRRIGIDRHLHTIVVSADIGRVKPHPDVFEALLDQLGLEARSCLFVGDNWLGDIQGAKGAGMKAAHTLQFDTPERFEPQPADHEADWTIEHLRELEEML